MDRERVGFDMEGVGLDRERVGFDMEGEAGQKEGGV